MIQTACAIVMMCAPCWVQAQDSSGEVDFPSLSLTLDDSQQLPGIAHGQVSVVDSKLVAPIYPDFVEHNKVLQFVAPAWIQIPDSAEDTLFDFDNGDEVTFEAWVRVDSLGSNMCLVSKGRTGTSGEHAINQNWAFRLTGSNGQACVNFLFRSRKTEDHAGDWHRWTSKSGFSSGSRWHHVAISYKFGEPKSIKGFIDGKQVKGAWDMGGETTRPPVVDNDDVWIGSTMGGLKSNSLNGALDNLVIHRRLVPASELSTRFNWSPPPVKPPSIPDGKIVVQMFGPIDSISSFPLETADTINEWQQNELAFVRLPFKYDAWGVRDDWGKTVLVRAWKNIQLPAGKYKFLARSRGMAKLQIDDRVLLTTPPQANRSGAHHVVDPLPEVVVPGMRPAAMSDNEVIAEYESDGQPHRLLYEIIVGGPKYRLEFGETCLAIAKGDDMFHIVSDATQYPLTDEGWQRFTTETSVCLTELDRVTRQTANQDLNEYWTRRHNYAKNEILQSTSPASIDELTGRRIAKLNSRAELTKQVDVEGPSIAGADFFQQHVQPIFDAHCIRCHGEKQQGGLLINNRERLLAGGESGQAAVVPGKPDGSYLFELVSAHENDYRMPPKGNGLTKAEVVALRQWISDGAIMPAVNLTPIRQPAIVDDHTFLRRVFIDTVGVPPTAKEAKEFLSDSADHKREKLVDQLLNDDRWADNWVGYWQDVLAENPNLLKPTLNNTGPFRFWIHEALIDNKPVDRFATELILMRGSTWGGGAAGFSQASQNDTPMAAKAHVIGSAFLGVNMKCARCHDAPYHDWKQADLFQLAAMLERKTLKIPATSSVPAAFFEKQERKSLIEVSLKPGAEIEAHFPFAEFAPTVDASLLIRPDDSRELLAVQVTASRRFAEVIANRIWKRLMGAGLVEPVDDWEGNPPSDPELMSALADLLILVDYDLKKFARQILVSEVYQREAIDVPGHRERYFAGPYRRRMSAEQIVDSALHVVGQQMHTEQLTMDVEGTLPAETFLNFGFPKRSWEFSTLANERDRPSLALPRAQAIVDVLKAFGWRNSRPEPETEREETPNLIQPGILANGTLGVWLTRLSDDSPLTQLLLEDQAVESLIDSLYLRILTRQPTEPERAEFTALLTPGYESRMISEKHWGTPDEPRRFPYVSWSNHLNTEANVIKVEMQELVRQGPPPTRYLQPEWRERAEDSIWSLLNSPEMIMVP